MCNDLIYTIYCDKFIFIFTVQYLNVIYVQKLNNMKNNQDYLNILRKIKSKPDSTQRELAQELGFSLGKLNYFIKKNEIIYSYWIT